MRSLKFILIYTFLFLFPNIIFGNNFFETIYQDFKKEIKVSIETCAKITQESPIDYSLQPTLLATCTGNADVVVSQTGVTNPANTLSAQDGMFAELYDLSDQLVLDLTDELLSGATYTVRWRKNSGFSNPTVTVEESADGASWTAATGSAFTVSSTTFGDQSITTSANTRYLRFTTTNGGNLDIDAVSYTNADCAGAGGGTPSGNLSCSAGAGEIAGKVFDDLDYDGLNDAGETNGFENITVTATDSLGNNFSATTDANGDYTITGLTSSRTYRVEFTNIPSWAEPTFFSGDNGTMVQFVQADTCANLGIAYPADYCQTNPTMAIPCYEKWL